MAARIVNASSGFYPGLFLLEFDIGRASGEQDAGYSFKAGDVIRDAWLDVETEEATGTTTIDLGLNGTSGDDDPDGLLDGVSTAAAGTVQGTLASAGQTLGTLLHVDESGAGVLSREPHVVTSESPLTYTLGSAATELVAKGYVLFWRSPRLLP